MSIGSLNVDILAVDLPAVAEPGMVVYAPREIETRIGGHPIDVAIDLVELGAAPEDVAVVAAVGDGLYGRFVRSIMDDHRLTGFLQTVADRDTGKNLVLETIGEDRRFHIDPGANWVLDAAHVAAALEAWEPDAVTIRPGYTGIDLELDRALGPAGDAIVFLDVMQPHPSHPHGYLQSTMRRADIVHCNETEAVVVTGAASIDAAVDSFIDAGVRLVLITAGGGGATGHTETEVIRQPGFATDVVDVTGAGDAFCAGFLAALDDADERDVGRLDPEQIASLVSFAQATGAAATTAVGCVEGVSSNLVARLVAEQGDAVRAATEFRPRK